MCRRVQVVFYIQATGFLAAIESDDIGTLAVDQFVIVAGEVSHFAFDLDHPCASIGQFAGGIRCRNGQLQRDRQYAV